jgi:hypothetical protein
MFRAKRTLARPTGYIPSIAGKLRENIRSRKGKNRLKLDDYKEWNNEGFKLLDRTIYDEKLKRGELPPKTIKAVPLGRNKSRWQITV